VTSLESALRRIQAELTAAHVSFALIGGLAVSARTEPRFTRDADLATAVSNDAEAEALIQGLGRRGYVVKAVVEQDGVGRLATVRLTSPAVPEGPVIDLLFASSGIEREIVTSAEPLELLSNLTIRVAQTGHLIALKVLSRDDVQRPQDIADLRALIRSAAPSEMTRASQALALIEARGYHRGRDLRSEYDALVRDLRQ
jgi:nucleotidyltransferase AbiEii toxin of type IV toxin-antitoxin system